MGGRGSEERGGNGKGGEKKGDNGWERECLTTFKGLPPPLHSKSEETVGFQS